MINKNATQQRKKRISKKLHGTSEKPRIAIFRSNTSVYAQVIDDVSGKTLFGVSEKHIDSKKGTKTEKAKALGITLAAKAKEKNITRVIFDKGSYGYHGRVKAIADGAREGGLIF